MQKRPDLATLWIGDRLSWIEILCLQSFLDAGHSVAVFAYEKITNIPDGIEIKDAAQIFPTPPSKIDAVTLHADQFRLQLLAKTDYVWIDSDIYCLRPFDFDPTCVVAKAPEAGFTTSVLGLSRTANLLTAMVSDLENMPKQDAKKKGPDAATILKRCVETASEQVTTYEYDVFCPIAKNEAKHFVKTRKDPQTYFTENTLGVHLWGQELKSKLLGTGKNTPKPGSFLHILLKKHNVSAVDAPIPGFE